LLQVMASQLRRQNTPVAGLALLMFKESDDPNLQLLANSYDYAPLKEFPWLVGYDDWMPWIWVGLSPDDGFSVKTDRAKAGLLVRVRQYISQLDIRPPVIASSSNYENYTNSGTAWGWGGLKPSGGAPPITDNDRLKQMNGFAALISARIAATLGISVLPDQELHDRVAKVVYFIGPSESMIAESIARRYLSTFPLQQPSDGTMNSVSRLIPVLVQQQGRLMALASYALVADQRRHAGKAKDIGMDEVFSQLATIKLAPAEVKTHFDSTLSASDLSAAAGVDLHLISQCVPLAVELTARHISLRDRTYLELLDLSCRDNHHMQIAKSGVVPTDIARLLEVNPQFPDIISQSLATRDLGSLFPAQRADPDDLSLILTSPWLSLSLCLADLAHPETPWEYTKDVLLANYPKSVEWFIPGWRPASPMGGPEGWGKVLLSPTEFVAKRRSFFAGTANLLEWEAEVRFLNGIAPTINAMPSEHTVCFSITDSQGSGMSCGDQPTIKAKLVSQFNAAEKAVRLAGILSSSLSGPGCLSRPANSAGNVETVTNEATNEFVTYYDSEGCGGAIQGQVALPHPLDLLLRQALEHDPIFLNRYQLDLVQSSPDSGIRFGTALAMASAEAYPSSQPHLYNSPRL
jgi:hypothetical protein